MKRKSAQELLQERASLVEAQAAIVDQAKAEGRDLTEEEVKRFEELDQQIEALDKEIEAAQRFAEIEAKVQARRADLNRPAEPRYRPDAVGVDYSVNNKRLDDGGFKSLGEFLHAVRFGDPKGRLQYLRQGQGQSGGIEVPDAFKAQVMPWLFKAEWSVSQPNQGGVMVPPRYDVSQILAIEPQGAIVRPRATEIPAGDPPDSPLTLPALDQGTRGVFAGVQVTWIQEGEQPAETQGYLREVTLQPYEVAADTVVTDKLLRNWEAASSTIATILRRAVVAAEDVAFLTGDGTGKPTGILNSPGAVKVNRATANDIQYVDLVNMLAALLPDSMDRAVWVASVSTLPKLAQLQDPAGRYIYVGGDASRGIPATLLGIPIVFTGRLPALGAKGDIVLADFSYYLIKNGSGPFVAASEHVLFRQNKTVIKIVWNVDGKSWVAEPLLLEDGTTKVSPYVVLDVPAA